MQPKSVYSVINNGSDGSVAVLDFNATISMVHDKGTSVNLTAGFSSLRYVFTGWVVI